MMGFAKSSTHPTRLRLRHALRGVPPSTIFPTNRMTRPEPEPVHDPANRKALSDALHRQTAGRYPHPPARGAGEIRLRSERVPDAGLSPRRISGVLRLSRCPDGEGWRPDQSRTRDDRGGDLKRQPMPLLRHCARRDPAHSGEESASSRPDRGQLPQGGYHAAPARHARLRDESERRGAQDFRSGFYPDRRPRFQRRRHLGYCRDFGVLRTVEPDGERHRHAAERRILYDGARAEIGRSNIKKEDIALLDGSEIVLRLGVATLAGGLIGLNRDLHGKPIGLKTLGLVGLATAMVVVLADPSGDTTKISPEASRIIQGILTGIGFLGAGVIVRAEHHFRVRGLTSAACTWLTACVGIACGIGQWRIVVVALAITFGLLTVGHRLERWLHRVLGGKDDPAPKSPASIAPVDTPPG